MIDESMTGDHSKVELNATREVSFDISPPSISHPHSYVPQKTRVSPRFARRERPSCGNVLLIRSKPIANFSKRLQRTEGGSHSVLIETKVTVPPQTESCGGVWGSVSIRNEGGTQLWI